MTESDDRAILRELLAALDSPSRRTGLSDSDPATLPVARYHRLTPLLDLVVGRDLPRTFAEVCRRDRLSTVARNLFLGQVAEECLIALGEAGIRAVVLKGLAYERLLYRDASGGVRPTADVDLLVPAEARRAAFGVLDGRGFEPRAAAPGFDDPDYHEVAWRRSGVEIDLHMALAPTARCAIDYAEIWSDVEPIALGQTRALALAPRHAAVFHTLHMAIDHFHVPAIYLVDLSRMLPNDRDLTAAESTARDWRCLRPFETAVALAAAFLPAWAASLRLSPPPKRAGAIVARYGGRSPLARAEQLRRKLIHFDAAGDALRYGVVQARRNAGELIERHWRKRSASERLRVRR